MGINTSVVSRRFGLRNWAMAILGPRQCGLRKWAVPMLRSRRCCARTRAIVALEWCRSCARACTISVLPWMSCVGTAWAVNPDVYISQYAHSAWRVQDGVLNGSPYTITQTTDGYIWVGTLSGLLRFDGVRFTPWTPADGGRLPSAAIAYLLGASDGSLWIGMKGGLSRWKNNQLSTYPMPQGTVAGIAEDRNGEIWFTRAQTFDSAGPLCQIVAQQMRCHGEAEGVPRGDGVPLVEDKAGDLWIGINAVVTRWKSGMGNSYRVEGMRPNMTLDGVDALAAADDGSLWVGVATIGPGQGLHRLVDGIWTDFVAPGLDGRKLEVQALFRDRENALWVGTLSQGIYRIYGARIEHYQASDGLSAGGVFGFFEDHEGNLWVAGVKGVDCFRPLRVTSFSAYEGIPADEVDSVFAASDGRVWIGGPTGMGVLKDGKLASAPAGLDLPRKQITSILEDHAGRMWIGIDNTLSVYHNGKSTRIDRPDGMPIGMTTGLTEDTESNIWAVTNVPPRTVYRIQDLTVRDVYSPPLMPAARKVAADPSGGIWLGLLNGDLAHFRNGKLDVVPFHLEPEGVVNELIVDSDGAVLGGTPQGMIGWRNGRQQKLTVRNGLPCDVVYALVKDSGGGLWLYTQCGLINIPRSELQRWWTQPDALLEFKLFTAADGVTPGLAPFDAGATRAPDGRLWFANGVGLQMIDPISLGGNSVAPPVHIESVVADRKSYEPEQVIQLPSLTRELQIDYTALSFVAPQKVRFRYELEGHDSTWQEPGNRRQAFYNDLAPGSYRFHVIASNDDGVWNEVGDTLDFRIATVWFQAPWFKAAIAAAAVLLGWLSYRLRIRKIAKALNTRFDERLAERTRIARNLHDTVVQTIQGSKLVADDALEQSNDAVRMRHALQQLSTWLGQAMQESRAALNSLRTPTLRTHDLAAALRQVAEDGAIRGSVEIIVTVSGDSRKCTPSFGTRFSISVTRRSATPSCIRGPLGWRSIFNIPMTLYCACATTAGVSMNPVLTERARGISASEGCASAPIGSAHA